MNIKKFLVGASAGALLLAATAVPAFAAGNPNSILPAVKIYGPFASSSPDSGTCGNDWANDTFDRFFRVNTNPNPDDTYTVVEQFKNGTFTTVEGASPGACETNPGGTLAAGITGTLTGDFIITVSGGTFNPGADCSVDCNTTAGFIHTVFGSSASYDVFTFAFNYSSSDQSLLLRTWRNASANRGGNLGDIATGP